MYEVPPEDRRRRLERVVRASALLGCLSLPFGCLMLFMFAVIAGEPGDGCNIFKDTWAACVRRQEQAAPLLKSGGIAILVLSLPLLIGWKRRWHTMTLAVHEVLLIFCFVVLMLLWPD